MLTSQMQEFLDKFGGDTETEILRIAREYVLSDEFDAATVAAKRIANLIRPVFGTDSTSQALMFLLAYERAYYSS